MIIQSKYTKIFNSKDLTRLKYDELHDFAVLIQIIKNTVSQYVNDNLLHFLEYNKFQFLKAMRAYFKDVIPSSFDSQLYTQVFTCYQNKFNIQKVVCLLLIMFNFQIESDTDINNIKDAVKSGAKLVKGINKNKVCRNRML